MTINAEFMSGFYAGLAMVAVLGLMFVLGRGMSKPKKEEIKK